MAMPEISYMLKATGQCWNCGKAKDVFCMPPTVGGFHDGVICTAPRVIAEQGGEAGDIEINLFRIEAVDDTATCGDWTAKV